MTTSVVINTHAWPVEVTTTDQYGDKDPVITQETVHPASDRTVYLTDSRTLSLRELPLPKEPIAEK